LELFSVIVWAKEKFETAKRGFGERVERNEISVVDILCYKGPDGRGQEVVVLAEGEKAVGKNIEET